MSELIKCNTCGQAIASLAQSCPSCGAPNDWLHPDVVHFLSVKDATGISKKFFYTHTKTTIAGQTEASSPVWAWVIAAVICAIGGVLTLMLGIVAMLPVFLISFFVLLLTKRADHFHADVGNRTWSSSNEPLWKPVRVTLKL